MSQQASTHGPALATTKDKAHRSYSASAQAQGQFAGSDNQHSEGRPGVVESPQEDRGGVEEVPFEDDRPEHFPEGDTQSPKKASGTR